MQPRGFSQAYIAAERLRLAEFRRDYERLGNVIAHLERFLAQYPDEEAEPDLNLENPLDYGDPP